MSGDPVIYLCALLGALAAGAAAGGDERSSSMLDTSGDAVVRRTDDGADGLINPASVLPDLVSVVLEGWLPFDAAVDPYAGELDESDDPDLVRIELRFEGLVNPPGTIGLGGHPFDPFEFGPSPVYGWTKP